MRWIVRAALLALAEFIVACAGWWLNASRRDQGPVLVPLTHNHGLHRMDLTMVALGILVATAVFGCPGWKTWTRFWGEPTGTPDERHPPDAPPGP